MTHDPFSGLRAAYLRAIARAWRDPEYAAKLYRASKQERTGALAVLEKDFNFKFPFEVKFAIDDVHPPRWDPVRTRGWIGYADDFLIHLPKPPEQPEQRASALARYYQEFPTLLGRARGDQRAAEAPDEFGEFGGITLRALALAWNSDTFAAELYKTHDARALVQDYFDYIVPWNFKLRFREHTTGSDDHWTSDERSDAYWAKFPLSEITVHLPRRPDSPGPNDVQIEPIALAAYNDTGPQYPFTCG